MRSDANRGLELYSMSRLTECRSALEGIVPQWVQPPPIESCFSIMMTLRLLLANCIAAPSPPGPLPITTTSNWRSLVFIQRSSWLYPFVLSSYSNEKPMCLASIMGFLCLINPSLRFWHVMSLHKVVCYG